MTFISAGEFSSSSQSRDEALGVGVWSVESNGTQTHLALAPFGKPKEGLALRQSGEFILLAGRAFTKRRL